MISRTIRIRLYQSNTVKNLQHLFEIDGTFPSGCRGLPSILLASVTEAILSWLDGYSKKINFNVRSLRKDMSLEDTNRENEKSRMAASDMGTQITSLALLHP